eukprot:2563900-Rhodomonas_salina.2
MTRCTRSIVLCARYAMSGTGVRCAYAMGYYQCPVLRYAMSGTDMHSLCCVRYCAMQCPAMLLPGGGGGAATPSLRRGGVKEEEEEEGEERRETKRRGRHDGRGQTSVWVVLSTEVYGMGLWGAV